MRYADLIKHLEQGKSVYISWTHKHGTKIYRVAAKEYLVPCLKDIYNCLNDYYKYELSEIENTEKKISKLTQEIEQLKSSAQLPEIIEITKDKTRGLKSYKEEINNAKCLQASINKLLNENNPAPYWAELMKRRDYEYEHIDIINVSEYP